MQIFAILGLVLKFLPYVAPILKGFFGALNNLSSAESKSEVPVIDMEKLEKFIEEQTNQIIRNTIEKHKGQLVAYVPSEEEAARNKRMDDLLAELERAQKEYDDSKKIPPELQL